MKLIYILITATVILLAISKEWVILFLYLGIAVILIALANTKQRNSFEQWRKHYKE
jgi:hypothetical protein